jgi:glycosyltransferase involved in cell wall biosynthesis
MNMLQEDIDVGAGIDQDAEMRADSRSPDARPMKACMVSYSIYDSDNRVRRYAETLVKNGYRVDAVALRRETQGKNNVINGVRVFRLQSRVKNEKSKFDYLAKLVLFFLRSLLFLTREQLKERYDLIHVHSVPDFEVFAALYPKIMGSKVILDIHDIVPEFYASKFSASQNSLMFKSLVTMERMSTAFSDHVIASNHIWQKRLQGRSVAESKVTTILNFPDTQVFQLKGRNRDDDKFILLYPGTLNYHQGLDIAIRAFSAIKDNVPKAEFHIYGSGDQSEFLKSLVGELGLENKVFFKGSLAVEQMVRVIENADLGIVPKRKSGFGNEAFSTKILEFMAMGVPVIVPDTEIDTYYFDEKVAKFFRADDEKSLADAMFLLIKNAAVRERLVRSASEFVKQYTWDVNQHIYLDLVDSLLNSRNDGGVTSILERTN